MVSPFDTLGNEFRDSGANNCKQINQPAFSKDKEASHIIVNITLNNGLFNHIKPKIT